MNQLIAKRCVLFSLAIVIINIPSNGQQNTPWSETFVYGSSYPTGLVTASGGVWAQAASGSPVIQITSGSLSYFGYSLDGQGNKIELAHGASREDAGVLFTSSTTNVYGSFMARFTAATTSGDIFFHFTDNGGAGTYAVVRAKDDGTGKVQFAIQKKDGAISPYTSLTTTTMPVTLLIVVAYKFNGSLNDDEVKLWINPSLGGTEPTPDITHSDTPTDPDAANIGGLVFLQSTDGPDVAIAGLKVATSWSDAPLPIQLTNFNAIASRFGVDLQWSTETETNNYGFEIERRQVQGSGFKAQGDESWTVVGFVRGAGTSTSPQEYSFTDSNVEPGRYAYRIKQIDFGGAFTYYSAAEVEVGLAPKELALEPNYPNPFNPSTNISFTIPQDGRAVLKVYNMLGQEVATLFNEDAVAGRLYKATFDASSLPTGVYVSRLEFGGQAVMRKMLFVK
jgi:hypothetical protein